ncbi:type II secretion system F family protein [Halofilum ochraceum]|uniref:type II secretion system F family protein n=1 Tax=Halofilum ochraceum TaxID=1611323 RepID=UPI0008DA8584|nr:type II secretion system F family protein [Halofilum ochraceum]
MDQLLSAFFGLLHGLTTQPEMAQLGFAAMLGVAVFVLMVAVLLLATSILQPIRSRLRRLDAEDEEPAAANAPLIERLVEPIGNLMLPRAEESRIRANQRLRHAGILSSGALSTYFGVKFLLAVLLPAIAVTLLLGFTRMPGAPVLLFGVAAAIAGYLAPNVWLEFAVRERTRRIRHGLPDALDLLVACSEAGLGLVAAIQRVAADLEISHPELAAELRLFGMQTRAGMSNRDALRDLEHRTGVEDVRGLVTTLLQSMRFGTSIASTLRIYSEEIRDKRIQRAEEHAAKVGTKMLFPLVLCIFPSFFVVTLGPPILGAVRALSGSG